MPLDEVAALHARTVARLMNAAGLAHAEAERRAVAMVAAALRNDPRLVPHQNDPLKCFVCGGPGREGSPLLPILTPKQWVNLWLCRSACHATFRQQQAARVAELMRSALPAAATIARP
ncbi:hypothetical protein [Xanthobacter oligotrophicus]|uniref:hypothetical protein n=1 Tax=Xanthobacter oligotrophicus TaxID=2607286 RepID=UPI0011F1AA6F|nr:hypothetical protein [Xanthobacter oligotrophicus]